MPAKKDRLRQRVFFQAFSPKAWPERVRTELDRVSVRRSIYRHTETRPSPRSNRGRHAVDWFSCHGVGPVGLAMWIGIPADPCGRSEVAILVVKAKASRELCLFALQDSFNGPKERLIFPAG